MDVMPGSPQDLSRVLKKLRGGSCHRMGTHHLFRRRREGHYFPHSDPMIIRANIYDFDVGRVLVDTGSSINVLFADTFNDLGIDRENLNKEITPLLSFLGDVVKPIGSIQLPLAIGHGPKRAFLYTHFLVVDCLTAYNAIIGRPALCRMKAVLCPHILLLKFPTYSGIGQIREDQLSAGYAMSPPQRKR